jgi:predicted membrane GTPase involved in stress response
MLPEKEAIELEASDQGLLLRAETEAELEHCIEILHDYYGSQIRFGAPTVRYHRGETLEEPYMGVRVRCSPEYFAAVRSDLRARRASIEDSECNPTYAVIRATAPLARLIGYSWNLSKLTAGTAHEVMWLSHYAPIESPTPKG